MVPIDFLSCLVGDELTRRADRLLERRRKQAQFRDPQVTLDNFDFNFNKKMNRSLVFDLATATFVARHEDAMFLGPPGTGKSHLAQAIGKAVIGPRLSCDLSRGACLARGHRGSRSRWKTQGTHGSAGHCAPDDHRRLGDAQVRTHSSRFEPVPAAQVADLIAGAGRVHAEGIVARSKGDPFFAALVDAGLLNALAGGVWPTNLISPEEPDTDGPIFRDAAEFMSQLVKPERRKTVT